MEKHKIKNSPLLEAKKRTVSGRAVKRLRQQGILPANIYGKKIMSVAIEVDYKNFKKVYDEVGETGLLELDLKGDKRPVLVHNIQLNPKTDEIIHVDFLQVDLKEKVEAEVPVELSGESPAEKQGIGTVVQYINDLQVEALPTDLPEKFIVDVSLLGEVDQAIFVKDIKVDRSKIEIKADVEEIVVKVEPPQKEEVVVPPPVAEGEVVAEGTTSEPTNEQTATTEKTPGSEEPQKG